MLTCSYPHPTTNEQAEEGKQGIQLQDHFFDAADPKPYVNDFEGLFRFAQNLGDRELRLVSSGDNTKWESNVCDYYDVTWTHNNIDYHIARLEGVSKIGKGSNGQILVVKMGNTEVVMKTPLYNDQDGRTKAK